MTEINLTKIYNKYKGLWVALSEAMDTVITSGKDAKTVYENALKKGYNAPILFKVPLTNKAYIGSSE